MSEKAAKNQLSQAFKDYDIFYYNTRDAHRAGVADMYVCPPGGRSVWIELKKKKAKESKLSHPLSKLQANFLRKITNRGGLGLMVVQVKPNAWCIKLIEKPGEVNALDWHNTMSTEELIEYICE